MLVILVFSLVGLPGQHPAARYFRRRPNLAFLRRLGIALWQKFLGLLLSQRIDKRRISSARFHTNFDHLCKTLFEKHASIHESSTHRIFRHGILASAEFLAETKADAFQGSLVDTISSCGRTLLDTINHILDYSKINSFESNWRNAHKPGNAKARTAGVNRRSLDKESPPMMNIYSTVDVAVLTEEVVEGVYAGQIYQDISSTEATDFSTGAKAEASDRGIRFENQTRSKKVGKKVEVIIDIAHENYVFTTQPGALRRVSDEMCDWITLRLTSIR